MFKKITLPALVMLAFLSCKKEKSLDTFGGANPIFIGNNCRISQILTVDSFSSVGYEAHNIFFNAAGNATRSQIIDSLSSSSFFDESFTYKGDTIYVRNIGFFVKNSSGRVQSFKGPEDPTDPFSDTVTINFTYSAAGALTKAEYFYFGIPIPLVRSTYTYTGNNLTKARTDLLVPSFETIIESELVYNTAQTVRDFIYTFPDAYELYPFLPALNFGNKPTNALTKVTTKIYDAGLLTDSLVTTYKNYKLSNDGYVLEFFADGDFQDGMGIYNGRTKFKYFCK